MEIDIPVRASTVWEESLVREREEILPADAWILDCSEAEEAQIMLEPLFSV